MRSLPRHRIHLTPRPSTACRWLAECFVFAFCLPLTLAGQPSVDLQQAFVDLSHDEVLMSISAHPDDEDGATLAYYRMKYGVTTYSVLFTRGEGGQNEKGSELYEELGVLRSAETEAAAKILGVDVRFLNFVDFGFSKTATETFQKWGGQREVLRRLVFIVRTLKPDVIITNHNTIDGHGNHQAVAVTAIAAFDAAADSTIFPEQLKERGVAVWQPRKLFFRNFGRSDQNADVVNSIDEPNTPRGVSYLDIAAQALRMHRTQGLDRVDLRAFTRGRSLYKLVRANSLYDRDSTTFFSGIDILSDPTMAAAAKVRTAISNLRITMARDSLLKAVALIIRQIDSIGPSSACLTRIIGQWQLKLETLVRQSCGLTISCTLNDQTVVPRQKVSCTLDVTSNECALSDLKVQFELPTGWSMNESVGYAPQVNDHEFKKEFTLIVGDSPYRTLPKSIAQYRPIEQDQTVKAALTLKLGDCAVRASAKPVFDVAAPYILSVTPTVAWIPLRRLQKGATFEYTVRNFMPHKTAGKVRCVGPPGWRAEVATFTIAAEDSSAKGMISVVPPDTVKAGDYGLRCISDYWTQDVTVRIFDVAVARNINVGIIKSYDTTLEGAVEELGVEHKDLDSLDLKNADLSRFTTILVDIRAYLVREDLRRFNARLLDFVRAGGNLVVMYQREAEWKPDYAPYPFQISRSRVADEEAPIRILTPEHPLLSAPNPIHDDDWSGWKQERGVYFPSGVPKEYAQLLSTHDPDEAPLTTGLLVAKVGAGSYVYTSLVWYRQMKEIHPGAVRCFANMISYTAHRR